MANKIYKDEHEKQLLERAVRENAAAGYPYGRIFGGLPAILSEQLHKKMPSSFFGGQLGENPFRRSQKRDALSDSFATKLGLSSGHASEAGIGSTNRYETENQNRQEVLEGLASLLPNKTSSPSSLDRGLSSFKDHRDFAAAGNLWGANAENIQWEGGSRSEKADQEEHTVCRSGKCVAVDSGLMSNNQLKLLFKELGVRDSYFRRHEGDISHYGKPAATDKISVISQVIGAGIRKSGIQELSHAWRKVTKIEIGRNGAAYLDPSDPLYGRIDVPHAEANEIATALVHETLHFTDEYQEAMQRYKELSENYTRSGNLEIENAEKAVEALHTEIHLKDSAYTRRLLK